MIFREAIIEDIPQMQLVRNAVKENVLSNPDLITNKDYEPFITTNGKGWVCEIDGGIVGFSIVDLFTNNIWALFIFPDFEKKGIGTQLHNLLMNWYFSKTQKNLWLSTEPLSRAESFYRNAGWKHVGMYGNELKFEMDILIWNEKN